MGIRAICPNGHELHLKSFLAGKKGICPKCGAKFRIPDGGDDDDSPTPGAATAAKVAPATVTPATVAARAPAATRPLAKPGLGGAFEEPIDDLLHGGADAESMLTSTRVEKPASQPTATRVVAPKSSPQPAAVVLSEAPEAAWYMQLAKGERFGPTKAPEMQSWLEQGRVPVDALVWRQGWSDWKTAGLVFSGLPAAATTAPSEGNDAAPAEAIQTDESVAMSTASIRRRMAQRFERSLTSVVVLAVVVVALAAVLAIVIRRGG